MARTFQTVYDNLINEKNTYANLNTLQPNIDSSQTLLNDLTTTSKVARWRLIFAIVAIAIVAVENLWDAFMLVVNAVIAGKESGTPIWYKEKVLEFQHGDALTLVNKKYVYNPVNTSNRIVSQCAVVDGNPVTIKVAQTVGGVLAPLTAPQISALVVYVNKIKFAGTATNVVSLAPDELALDLLIKYDPLVLDNTGQLISSPGTYPVIDAINNYLKTLEFNGDLVINKLLDQLQNAQGVSDPTITQSQSKIGLNPWVPFTIKYSSSAGYMVLNLANTTITYQPNV